MGVQKILFNTILASAFAFVISVNMPLDTDKGSPLFSQQPNDSPLEIESSSTDSISSTSNSPFIYPAIFQSFPDTLPSKHSL